MFKVLPAADGQSVYVAGRVPERSREGDPRADHQAQRDDAARSTRTSPAPSITGDIRDLELVGNHLFIAGKFTHINGVAQRALGTVYADTGRRDPYFNAVLTGTHNTRPGALTNVLQISIDQQNQHLVAVGNFTTVDGQSRHQIARFDVANLPTTVNTTVHQSLSPWSTNLFTSPCSGNFDEPWPTSMLYSPNGTSSWSADDGRLRAARGLRQHGRHLGMPPSRWTRASTRRPSSSP